MFPDMANAMASTFTPGLGGPLFSGYPYGIYPAAPSVLPIAPSETVAATDEIGADIDDAATHAAIVDAPTTLANAPTDADQDGVLDGADLCPHSAADATVDTLGCAAEATIVLDGVNFHTDSAMLTPESDTILDQVAATLSANPGIKVEIAGHTDSDAADDYNQKLSQVRANVVMAYLTDHGVQAANLSAKGYGEADPLVTNDTPAHKAMNRRVELRRL